MPVPPTFMVHCTVNESPLFIEMPVNVCLANIAFEPSLVELNRPDSLTVWTAACVLVNVAARTACAVVPDPDPVELVHVTVVAALGMRLGTPLVPLYGLPSL